ncbi:Scr1 family TA system antitoxin-like transcriptional regulator [Micromonospora sp. NPDC048843]|uniref:helix-turn-helix domain-containing protein n=1 Tax=Micromonospora sp. NPDC048843 TaxID=3155389 RepID=UPI0033F14C33
MTIVEVAKKAELSTSTIQRFERGLFPAKLRTRDIRALCEVFGADDNLTAALEGLARQANVQSWWHEYDDVIPRSFNVYMGLEASVERMYTYSPDAVVGLLQTPDYAPPCSADGHRAPRGVTMRPRGWPIARPRIAIPPCMPRSRPKSGCSTGESGPMQRRCNVSARRLRV